MLDPHSLYEYSLSLQTSEEDEDVQQRLKLFEIFSRLYTQHRDLLNEILTLEQAGTKVPGRTGLFKYVQGIALGQRIFLVTNLLDGHTQALKQSQNLWLIGRDSHQVSLPIRDKRLSRCHAAIRYTASGFAIVDLDSTNGTFVNGERIRHQAPLQDGDQIRLGSMTFNFFDCTHMDGLPLVNEGLLNRIDALLMPPTLPDPNSDPMTEAPEPDPAVIDETLRFLRQSQQAARPLHPEL